MNFLFEKFILDINFLNEKFKFNIFNNEEEILKSLRRKIKLNFKSNFLSSPNPIFFLYINGEKERDMDKRQYMVFEKKHTK